MARLTVEKPTVSIRRLSLVPERLPGIGVYFFVQTKARREQREGVIKEVRGETVIVRGLEGGVYSRSIEEVYLREMEFGEDLEMRKVAEMIVKE